MRLTAGEREEARYHADDPCGPLRWCWNCVCNVHAVRVDRSAEVGVYAIDEVCPTCGEDATKEAVCEGEDE